jgi:hypothetical protein
MKPNGRIVTRQYFGSTRRRIPFSGVVARQVALSAEGRHVAVLTCDRLRVWEVDAMKEVVLASPPQGDESIFYGSTRQIALGSHGWYLATAFRPRASLTVSLAKQSCYGMGSRESATWLLRERVVWHRPIGPGRCAWPGDAATDQRSEPNLRVQLRHTIRSWTTRLRGAPFVAVMETADFGEFDGR